MATHEVIPELHQNRHFPIGDIVPDARKVKQIDEWFAKEAEMSYDEYCSMIKMHHKPVAEGGYAMRTYGAAIALCKTWDESRTDEAKGPFAQVGYRLATTFNQQVRFLPGASADMTQQLDQMSKPETIGGQRELAREFGRFAWEGMAYYPAVFEVHERLLSVGRARFDLYASDNREYFQAGMALPYIIAAASRLDGYTPSFNSMSDGANPPAKEFRHLFTDVEITPEDQPVRAYKLT